MGGLLDFVGALIGANSQGKAQSGAMNSLQQAGKASQVDIPALNAMISEMSKQNAQASADLEKQMTPWVPQIRQQAGQGILGGLGATSGEQQGQSMLLAGLGHGLNTPLMAAAIAKARANLALGGQLSPETQNAVMRQGLATAGTVAGPRGGLGLGRDITARDLGLTSMQVEQQRLGDAGQFGQMEMGGAQMNAQNFLQKLSALQSLNNGQFGRQMAAGQYGESIRQPNVGLDPSAAANIQVSNQNNMGQMFTNMANIYGNQANNWAKFTGQSMQGGISNMFGGANSLGGMAKSAAGFFGGGG